MKALVVYESLWGNTAAVARAIAEGLGPGAEAMSTAEVSSDRMSGVDLVVAGCPVHSMSMPSEKSRDQARKGAGGSGGAPPDLSHPSLRAWLAGLPRGDGAGAAFDTSVDAWYGRGAGKRIARGLRRAGYEPLAPPESFHVAGRKVVPSGDGMLLDGELDRAREWGAGLARRMAKRVEGD